MTEIIIPGNISKEEFFWNIGSVVIFADPFTLPYLTGEFSGQEITDSGYTYEELDQALRRSPTTPHTLP